MSFVFKLFNTKLILLVSKVPCYDLSCQLNTPKTPRLFVDTNNALQQLYYRLLGVIASNSNFCYWYTFANNDLDNVTSEENWLFYTVT